MNKRWWIYVTSSAVGFFVALWSAADWFNLMRGDRMTSSFCSLNSFWDCDRASLSIYGAWGDLPVGIFGAAFFWTLIALAFADAPRIRRWVLRLGLVGVFYFFAVLTLVLKTGCLICYTIYLSAIVAAIAGVSLQLKPLRQERIASVGWILGIAFLAIFGFGSSAKIRASVSEEELTRWFESTPQVALSESSPLVLRSSEKASVKMVEFLDFGCSVCQAAAATLHPFLESRPEVEVEFFPYPMDAECNSKVKRTAHPFACEWSRAAICAQKAGELKSFYRRIFSLAAHHQRLQPVAEWQSEFAWNWPEIDACMKLPETAAELTRLISVADTLQVGATPTYVISNRKFEGLPRLSIMKRLIDRAIRESKSNP